MASRPPRQQQQLQPVARNVQVITNSFPFKSLPKLTYYQYDMFSPTEKRPQKRQRLIHALQVHYFTKALQHRIVYDGGFVLYCPGPDTVPSQKFRIHDTNQGAPASSPGWYEITITRTVGEDITPADFQTAHLGQSPRAVNLLQLLLCQTQNQDQPMSRNKRAYFFAAHNQLLSSLPVELWYGYYQAVRPTIHGLVVTIDTTITAMYMSGNLVDVCMHILGSKDVRDTYIKDKRDPRFGKLANFLVGRSIHVKTSGTRIRMIRGLVVGPVGLIEFSSDEAIGRNGMMTIEEHYKNVHGLILRHSRTIGVVVKTTPNLIIIPLELCKMVAGQSYKKRLPPSAIPAINKLAVLKPKDKLSRITGKTLTVESPIRTYGQSEVLVEAGVAVGTMPLTVPGRMLLSLPVEYANAVVTPRDGTWNVLDKKFRTAMEMPRWAVACFAPSMSMDDIVRTMRELAQCCAKLGMVFGHPDPQRSFVQGSGQNVRRKLYDICGENNKNSVDMIFVILPGNAADIRREVKYLGDVELGVRTQCLLVDKLPRPGDRNASQYYNNVALKLNTRLGGCNATVGGPILTGLKSDPFMIVGADVSHPSPGSSRPSVASLLWSHNKYATAYGCIRRLQPSRQEIIQDLEAMFVHALDSFLQGNALKRENGHIYLPPKRIFFYRDGVSEGQFAIVKDFEIAAVKAAIAQVWNQRGFNGRPFPLLTFLIVGKRHHVTFFPDGHYEIVEDRKTGNCKPGLVVDDALANPQYKDFYLLSHAAILGTSRCAHYTVLLDENFQEDVAKLEELSYALCHAYARATRSVSIPAPVYYADLACDHAKFHMDPNAMFDLESDASSTTGSVADASLEEWNKAFHDVHKNLAHTMYFL